MTDEQKILLALVKLMFPREMLDYFEVVGFEIHEDSISVRLDERDRILKKKSGHTYVDYITLNVPPRAFSNVPLQIWSL